ncbi:hypothetical protein [Bacillus cereus group sp. BfR-BA-01317]|uniref:hypothetical protein n=1 Tax=Bacillus cereus group sp. BfR-BA-01317 TaxID=2920294 RepID=UPI001F59BE6C|nr:hypothetical protein [Bacillus cereus group sp. BfR-BA-01317]
MNNKKFDVEKVIATAKEMGMDVEINSDNPGFHFISENKEERIVSYDDIKSGYKQIKGMIEQADKREFLQSVTEGKWFQTETESKRVFLVKIQLVHPVTLDGVRKERELKTLWLSKEDPEAMAFSDVKESSFEFNEGVLTIHEASSYNFGSMEPGDDCIYDENGVLDEFKLKAVVLRNSRNGFVSEPEFDDMWAGLKVGAIRSIPYLETK